MKDQLLKFLATPFLVIGMVFGWLGAKIMGCEFQVSYKEIQPDDTDEDDDDLFI